MNPQSCSPVALATTMCLTFLGVVARTVSIDAVFQQRLICGVPCFCSCFFSLYWSVYYAEGIGTGSGSQEWKANLSWVLAALAPAGAAAGASCSRTCADPPPGSTSVRDSAALPLFLFAFLLSICINLHSIHYLCLPAFFSPATPLPPSLLVVW
jgi:hypothetical protein